MMTVTNFMDRETAHQYDLRVSSGRIDPHSGELAVLVPTSKRDGSELGGDTFNT